MDLRCDGNKLHAVLDSGLIEVKCTSRFCGADDGFVVLHYFDAVIGKLVQTRRYRDPARRRDR